MSRIQHILEKAEREGEVHRLHDPLSPAGPAIAGLPDDPLIAANGARLRRTGASTQVSNPMTTRTVSGARLDRLLIAGMSPGAVPAEQYRALRTRILHADTGGRVNLLLVTSPGRRDGKTLTAGNLALAMAQDHHRRVCLVDADLRAPQMQRLFGLPDGPGLSDVLSGLATLDDALVTLEEHQITILPGGPIPDSPAELLGSTAMRRCLETLRSEFDIVIIDAPATSPLADIGILTPLVDSLLLIVRAGVTSKPAIHNAIAALDSSKLMGVVLNEAA